MTAAGCRAGGPRRVSRKAAHHRRGGRGTAVAEDRIRVEQHSMVGTLWFAAWLFTIGLLDLAFWKGLLALVLWPYYLGTTVAPLLAGG